MNKGVIFRAYPDKAQQELINKILGCSRLVYNKGLAFRNEQYAKGEKTGYNQTSAMLTSMKKEEKYSFLKEADSIALQQALRDLDKAFVRFFEKKANHPVFKSKHHYQLSYRTLNQQNSIRIEGNRIRLPKLGYLKIRQSEEVGHINNVTVRRTATGKYFVVLNVDFEPEKKEECNSFTGIDVGIKSFYTDSNGNVVNNPKYLEKSQEKLKREQRKLSRKKKNSKNKQKQRKRVARVHEKIVNQRNDFIHKITTKLVSENQVIAVEDLNIKGLLKNHKLARAISSVSWSKFYDTLEYKAEWYGREVIRVPTMYPSSQTCSKCGYKNPLVKNLSVRTWECPCCHAKHDRDLNASVNILNKGLSVAQKKLTNTVGHTEF